MIKDLNRRAAPIEGLRLIVDVVAPTGNSTGLTVKLHPSHVVSARHAPVAWRVDAARAREQLRQQSFCARCAWYDADEVNSSTARRHARRVGEAVWLVLLSHSVEISFFTGTAPIFEAIYSVFLSSPREESGAFNVLNLVRARSCSAPQLYFLLVVMIREGIYLLQVRWIPRSFLRGPMDRAWQCVTLRCASRRHTQPRCSA
eukprot:6199861-Pleurochrysis_carterae.AAC.4